MVFEKWFGKKGPKPAEPPTADLFTPRMPKVDQPPTIEDVFAQARGAAAGLMPAPNGSPERHVVVVTPGRMLMFQPCPLPDKAAPMEKLFPREPKRNIAVISYTELQALMSNIGRAIPFMGLLMAIANIGHAVWVFEGHPSALAAGCRDADILIVDSGMIPFLQDDWPAIAAGVMRHEEIYVHDRKTFSLGKVVRKPQ